MEHLLTWLAETEAHPPIASCALHYELELFIHLRMEMVGWGFMAGGDFESLAACNGFLTSGDGDQRSARSLLSAAVRLDSRSGLYRVHPSLLEALRDALAQAIAVQPAAVSPHQKKMRVEMGVETQVEKGSKHPGHLGGTGG